MNKDDNTLFYQSIGNSIQENKNKIAKLEKKNLRLKNKNKNLAKENTNLKQALKEIREYINHEWFKRELIGVCNKEFQQWEIENILQIIDKVLGDEK